MKILLIGEGIFCKKMEKLLSDINLSVDIVNLDVDLDEISYKTLLYYYEVISSILDGLVQEDKVLCLVGLDINLLDFKDMPYIHLAYERKHELLSLYFYELLFSRLILSYPEVWWVFINVVSCKENVKYQMHTMDFCEVNKSLHEKILEKVFLCSYISPLFDIDGLYEYLLTKKSEKVVKDVKDKPVLFFLIEEEPDYVFYMFYALSEIPNTKVYPVHLYTLTEKFLKDESFYNGCKKLVCYIHDRYYYPVDLPSEKNLEDLKTRLKEFGLKTSDECAYIRHILVSFSDKKDDEDFIDHIIRKPLNSINSFKEEMKTILLLKDNTNTPQKSDTSYKGVHSSKGILSEIATKILKRAEMYYENVKSAEDAFVVAIMARYALKILEEKNLNLLYRAFSLKVKAESLGEVIFTGSDVNIDIHQKVNQIESFLKGIQNTFALSDEKIASMELLLLNEILNIYKEHNQLEEELALTNHIRKKVFEKKFKKNTDKRRNLSSKGFKAARNYIYTTANTVLYWFINKLLIKPLFSFKYAAGILMIFILTSVVLYWGLNGFKSEILSKALIDAVYGIITANIGGSLFGIFIAIFNVWLMVIVIGYFLTYIIRR